MARRTAPARYLDRSRPARRAAVPSFVTLLLATLLGPTAVTASTDADLRATLQLPQGEIDLPLETELLQSFDEEGAPFLIQIFDGCAINGRYWVFAAGLGSEAVPLTIFDEQSGNSHRTVLPAYVPGEPIETVFDPDALAICREGPTGGLPDLEGTATYTTVTDRCADGSESLVLRSEGRTDGYASILRDGAETDTIVSDDPIAIRDESADWDDFFLLGEGRTPGLVEGVRFSGDPGMVPRQAVIERALRDITPGRIRRAVDTAKSQLVPDQLIDDLGLQRVGCIFHVGLEFDSPGALAYLAEAGWISGRGAAIQPPQLVEPRFSVELVSADGETLSLPLTAPFKDGPGEGEFWEYASESSKVRILDGCALGGTFWTVAAAATEEPLELVVTDTETGNSATHVLWTDREELSRLSETAALPCLAAPSETASASASPSPG